MNKRNLGRLVPSDKKELDELYVEWQSHRRDSKSYSYLFGYLIALETEDENESVDRHCGRINYDLIQLGFKDGKDSCYFRFAWSSS